jgi:hypothetical protein
MCAPSPCCLDCSIELVLHRLCFGVFGVFLIHSLILCWIWDAFDELLVLEPLPCPRDFRLAGYVEPLCSEGLECPLSANAHLGQLLYSNGLALIHRLVALWALWWFVFVGVDANIQAEDACVGWHLAACMDLAHVKL